MRPALAVQEFIVSCLTALLVPVLGHGRLWEPPSRSSMWRLGYDSPINYQDMELFCGGVGVQYGVNGGKCGVCGDPWNGPRENEAGGAFANGIIVRSYEVGQVIDIVIDLTANHKGFFEFHICPSDDPFGKVTEDCLARYPLVEETKGTVKYPVPDIGYSGKIAMKFRLPAGIRCRACMLQWKYTAGNSWGANPDGTGCIGCGNQEQFYGCADVAIGHKDVVLAVAPTKPQWYYQTTMEWGVISTDTYDNTTCGAQSYIFKGTVCSLVLFSVINVVVVVLITFTVSS
ncbi:unnamed protein product [Candidula unifasciata]|uniref:Chitin-binding type-4 domain-containing protein n=1 Tax=Candidula unifasciata TaxID=100452 RepID=A0A8S3YP26_9EUPU|nr:unnamed protein product [Candidula unifasciata]